MQPPTATDDIFTEGHGSRAYENLYERKDVSGYGREDVSGHGFSRAESPIELRALAPATESTKYLTTAD